MMDLTMESFNVRCCECGKRITIFKSDLDIEESCYDHGDNCMGIEIIYEIQHEISCPKCGNDIEIFDSGRTPPRAGVTEIPQHPVDRVVARRRFRLPIVARLHIRIITHTCSPS